MIDLGFHCNRLRHLEPGVLDNGLARGEFYNFPPDEFPALKKALLSHNLARSVHSPLVRLDWYPNPPTWSFLCDVDRERRKLTLKMVAETMELAEDFGAEYVVAHFPVPSSDASGESEATLEAIAWQSADALAELSFKKGVPIHIEGVGPSQFLNIEFISKVLDDYSPLRYCFDSGHSHLAAQTLGMDVYEFACGVAPYLGSVHLWNIRDWDDYETFHHIAVHPSQSPEEGWVDIPRLLGALGQPAHPIVFESPHHYPEALGDHDFREGIQWVRQILETPS